MKPLHIILLLMAAVGIGAVISLYGNTTQYIAFKDAEVMAQENPGKEYHVVCQLNKQKPILYDPQKDPNYLEFWAIDSLGKEMKVLYGKPKPQDMERSQKLVLIGFQENDYFRANSILSKCPSKYEDEPVNNR
jgi:cytochrome c-type biogenesis protein CcmE